MKKTTLKILSNRLVGQKETIAVAESVTAGLVITTLSRAVNATSFLQGGIIVYNLGQKTKHLDVNPIHADETNCVSPEIAVQMAAEVSRKFCSQWGIAITGYAVPVPALKIKSCFAYYAIVKNGETVLASVLETRLTGQGRVQQYFVDNLLDSFARQLF
ncbi:MAG TPA: CinA family protein [Chryseolinea sp.]|nr:CinA family protein [Chryseolinea sp.]